MLYYDGIVIHVYVSIDILCTELKFIIFCSWLQNFFVVYLVLGLTPSELKRLAQMGHKAQKCSRRDLAAVMSRRGNGATTGVYFLFVLIYIYIFRFIIMKYISFELFYYILQWLPPCLCLIWLASQYLSLVGLVVCIVALNIVCNCWVFLVLYDYRFLVIFFQFLLVIFLFFFIFLLSAMDISADLTELGRTPVAVICAGIKSILDIPKTLEYLETQVYNLLRVDNNKAHIMLDIDI